MGGKRIMRERNKDACAGKREEYRAPEGLSDSQLKSLGFSAPRLHDLSIQERESADY
jgi:hypothetical protein